MSNVLAGKCDGCGVLAEDELGNTKGTARVSGWIYASVFNAEGSWAFCSMICAAKGFSDKHFDRRRGLVEVITPAEHTHDTGKGCCSLADGQCCVYLTAGEIDACPACQQVME